MPRRKATDTANDYNAQLEGLEFLDEADTSTEPSSDSATESKPPADLIEIARANQAAAKAAIRRLEADPKHVEIRPVPPEVIRPRFLTPEEAADQLPKRHVWRVTVGGEIARGGSRFLLRPGKIVTENEYDIPGLRAQGIQFEEVEV